MEWDKKSKGEPKRASHTIRIIWEVKIRWERIFGEIGKVKDETFDQILS